MRSAYIAALEGASQAASKHEVCQQVIIDKLHGAERKLANVLQNETEV
jgi:predicted DNA-binding protein (UPF0251 family)